MTNEYSVLAYYFFNKIDDPHREVADHKKFLENLDSRGRIYISEDGINGQMSLASEDVQIYLDWLHSKPYFQEMPIKIHSYHEHAFEKLKIKYRDQLVALDYDVDMSLTGEHVTPKKWKEMLETNNDRVVIDVRNDYEWKVGHFDGAITPPLSTFREFKSYAKDLQKKIDPKNTPVMMYCTGGIRCELYSALLKEEGFEKVYQLDGGVINYGLKEGSQHWQGKLFVFDDRMTVPISEEETPTISKCHRCEALTGDYYNCANMDCNHLFICCKSCLEELKGCCCNECQETPRVRPFQHQNPHKPFRKRHYFRDTLLKKCPV
ncbi:MAG: putative adenylyltransferase/sulfurtransferase MoeZ [Chlamydiae bacterium]|nr:putative adenylyltransferase/sulfurtransferase MoeZ [Chlamydiota bacterium]